jgi:ABC-type nitrate/sulfonate/bicarbonate transport system substrate-binding protein
MLWIRSITVLLLVALAGCTSPFGATRPAEKTVRFMAGYKAQANLPFVGVYVAEAKGYFAQQGLKAEISHSSGQGEHLKLTLQGSIDVTTADADSILARRAEGLPTTAIALLGQRGQRAFAVAAASEIRTPKDFEGKTVGYKVYQTPDYLAMLSATGVDRSRISEVPVGFDPRLLAAGKVDVYPVFESNEPDTLERLGFPVRLFRPIDHGVPSLGLTYMVRDELVEKDPDLLARFVKATMRGIEEARRDPEGATDIVMQHAQGEDRAHQLAMLKSELDMADGPVSRANGVGWMTREQWLAFHDSLLANGGLKAAVDVDKAFSTRALSAAYRNGQLVWP